MIVRNLQSEFFTFGNLFRLNYLSQINVPLQNFQCMQVITAVLPIMGRPSFQWDTTTEALPGKLCLSINYKPLRGALVCTGLGWPGTMVLSK